MEIWGVSVPDLVVVLAPAVAAAAFVARYFWTANKCMALLKQDYRRLKEASEKGEATHGDIYDLLREMNARLGRLEGKIGT